MRRIQFYLLKLGRHLNQKEEALCFVYVLYKCAIVYLNVYLGVRRCFFQIRKTNYNRSFPILPPLARRSNSVSIITSSYISPCLLV